MVKKKGKSKRTSLKDKYKVERRVVETNRKRKKASQTRCQGGHFQA
jgi:nuclear GTP-binding protein